MRKLRLITGVVGLSLVFNLMPGVKPLRGDPPVRSEPAEVKPDSLFFTPIDKDSRWLVIELADTFVIFDHHFRELVRSPKFRTKDIDAVSRVLPLGVKIDAVLRSGSNSSPPNEPIVLWPKSRSELLTYLRNGTSAEKVRALEILAERLGDHAVASLMCSLVFSTDKELRKKAMFVLRRRGEDGALALDMAKTVFFNRGDARLASLIARVDWDGLYARAMLNYLASEELPDFPSTRSFRLQNQILIDAFRKDAGRRNLKSRRLALIETLGEQGAVAAAAIPGLVAILDDSDDDFEVRLAVVESLRKIDPDDRPSHLARLLASIVGEQAYLHHVTRSLAKFDRTNWDRGYDRFFSPQELDHLISYRWIQRGVTGLEEETLTADPWKQWFRFFPSAEDAANEAEIRWLAGDSRTRVGKTIRPEKDGVPKDRLEVMDWEAVSPDVRQRPYLRKRLSEVEKIFETGDASERGLAIKELSWRISCDRLAPLVVNAALEPSPQVRESAMAVLWRRDRDGELAAALAYAVFHKLGTAHVISLIDQIKVGQQFAPQLLDTLRNHNEPPIRLACMKALARVGDPVEYEYFIGVLRDSVLVSERIAAVRALADTRPIFKPSIPLFTAIVHDRRENTEVRLAVSQVLQTMPGVTLETTNDAKVLEHVLEASICEEHYQELLEFFTSIVEEQEMVMKKTKQNHVRILFD